MYRKDLEMKRDDVFPSKYLKAADLNGKPVTVTIKSARARGGGSLGGRPVVAFCRRTSIARSQALEITQLQGSPPTTNGTHLDCRDPECSEIRIRSGAGVLAPVLVSRNCAPSASRGRGFKIGMMNLGNNIQAYRAPLVGAAIASGIFTAGRPDAHKTSSCRPHPNRIL
jgi:hypothetical protein